MRRLVAIGFIAFAFFAAAPALALEIENADEMPYPLDVKFIAEIWKETIRVTNEEAKVIRVEDDLKPPRIVYVDPPPEESKGHYADIEYWQGEKSGRVNMEKPRSIQIFRLAFETKVPYRVYGSIAQEFFHETLLHQYVTPELQHCIMLSRGTLEKVLRFIDLRLGTGSAITDSLMANTYSYCQLDYQRFLLTR